MHSSAGVSVEVWTKPQNKEAERNHDSIGEEGAYMKHNWVMKLLVLCNGAMAAGLCYTAYHLATYPFGFPDSPVMRWFERFETLFPNLGATPQFLLEMAAKGLPGGMTMESRWVAVVSSVILAVVTAAVTYGLVRDADWARNAFGVIALLQLLPLVLKLGLTALHLIVVGRAGIGGYLTGVTGTRIPLQYSVLGAFVAAGILRLMWRWRDESESHLTWPAEDAKPIAASPAFNAQTQEHRRRVSKWTWAMRAALLLQLAAFTLLEFSGKEARRNWSGEAILFWVIWAAVMGVMWYFLSREDPRLGVGLGLGCAGVQVLPALGLPILLLMLGFQTWFQVGLALLGVLAVLSLLVSGTVASIILGRAPLERTGIWGLGVLLPFVAATVFFQAIQERG